MPLSSGSHGRRRASSSLALGPHPQRELTPMLTLRCHCLRVRMAAGALLIVWAATSLWKSVARGKSDTLPSVRGEGAAYMTHISTRRDLLRGGLALTGLTVFGIPEWALPALAQGDVEALQLR